jgi:Glycosyl hydrolases family 16
MDGRTKVPVPAASGRSLGRRSILGWSAAGSLALAAAPLAAASLGARANGAERACMRARSATAASTRRRVLFEDTFSGHSLNRRHWNPYMCDNGSRGWPWLMQSDVAVPSSAIGVPDGVPADYDLPSAIRVDDGLTLTASRRTRASGYTWTGSVICSHPSANNFGSGTLHTTGVTFTDARVEVRARMPELTHGQWPGIWFLPAPGGSGAEIDLFEGGFFSPHVRASRIFAPCLHTAGNRQHRIDVGTNLSAGYHTYAMEYRQGTSIKVFFDGRYLCSFTRNVPTGPYFIILSNTIASHRSVRWHTHTQLSRSTPAVNRMHVSSVRVLAL